MLILVFATAACEPPAMTLDGRGGPDASPGCAAEADGVPCGDESSMICLAGACVESQCGDGFLDVAAGEQCDDGNQIAFDGCDPPSCTITCHNDSECDNGLECDGVERCDVATEFCSAGTPARDGSACSTGAIAEGVCGAGTCVAPGCGNGVVEPGETCDDGANGDPDDGCRDDCTFSCMVDPECDDGDVCNGEETCDQSTHMCTDRADLSCDDGSECTTDACDPSAGCVFTLIDLDGDGHAATSIASCGTDCDDSDETTNPDAPELCDTIDHDCDGVADPDVVPFWFPDCDVDGYAPIDAAALAVQSCEAPAPSGACAGWTARRPRAAEYATVDCQDADPMIRPGTIELAGDEIDQNCDGAELCFLDADSDGFRRPGDRTVLSLDTDCSDPMEAPASAPTTDCNDGAATTFPGAPELCNAEDDSCSGQVDLPGLSCVLGSSASCVECGYAGTQVCGSTCELGACGGFSFNRAYLTGPDLTHECGEACDADWCSNARTSDCSVVSGGPGAMVPPGRYEAEFYGGFSGTFDLAVDLDGVEAAAMAGWVSPGTGFPRVVVPFTVSGCASASVRMFAHEFASMRLYTVTIRRVGD